MQFHSVQFRNEIESLFPFSNYRYFANGIQNTGYNILLLNVGLIEIETRNQKHRPERNNA